MRSLARTAALAGACLAGAALASTASAVELPGSGEIFIETNGPKAPIYHGDWYSSVKNAEGGGYHYVTLIAACEWPEDTPLHVDLYSPEMNRSNAAARRHDEKRGKWRDNTRFELYEAGTERTGPKSPGVNGPGSMVLRTYRTSKKPEQWVRFATIEDPEPCGRYLLRAQTNRDDENSWRVRLGADDDANPDNAPPPRASDPDGVPGSGDEPGYEIERLAFQHEVETGQCHTFSKYAPPGARSLTWHSFDMDRGNPNVVRPGTEDQLRLSYYAPSDAFDPEARTLGRNPDNHPFPQMSGNDSWNGAGALRNLRVGDRFDHPETGWWRMVVCTDDHNQYISEGELIEDDPAVPELTFSKTDGLDLVGPGDALTYELTFENVASGPGAGPASALTVTDALPAETNYRACEIAAPRTGSCGLRDGVVTASLDEPLGAGESGQVRVTVDVAPDAPWWSTLRNEATLSFEDGMGNPYPDLEAADETTVAGPEL
jgi:uncharacterized repeat protein (TIGR01451 family)